MGSGASKNSDGGSGSGIGANVSVHFRHGTPSVPFDEAIGCFKAVGYSAKITRNGAMRSVTTTSQPGYLYRLVNSRTKEWHFYNDTTTFDFVVSGFFGPQNAIRPMGSAKMFRELPSGLVVVEMTVGPLETLPYISGDVKDGFDITFSAVPRGNSGTDRGDVQGRCAESLSALRSARSRQPAGTVVSAADARLREVSAVITHSPRMSPASAALVTTVRTSAAPQAPPSVSHAALSHCPNCHATTLVTTTVPSPAPSNPLVPPPITVLEPYQGRSEAQRKSPSRAISGSERGENASVGDDALTSSSDPVTCSKAVSAERRGSSEAATVMTTAVSPEKEVHPSSYSPAPEAALVA